MKKTENRLINGQYYLINGIIKCLYEDGLFFWEAEDGTKWFLAESLRDTNTKVEIIEQ